MNTLTRLLMPLAVIAAPLAVMAAPAHAQTLRAPATGTPAIEMATPAGWKGELDQDGNLTMMADDATGAILLTVLKADPGEPVPANDILAATFFSELGATPTGNARRSTFAGDPAETYKAQISVDGFSMEVDLVIRRLDDRNIAMAVLMAPSSITAEQRATNAANFAKVKIVTR